MAGALCGAQLIPALPGALAGIPAGLGLVAAVSHGANLPVPPAWWLACMVLGLLTGLALLTAIPAIASARQSPAHVLQSDTG